MSELDTGAIDRGRVEPRELEQEMRASFLDYAMSVIVSRALPDVRDGLKPVHRRVLYGMHEAGLQPNRPYKKSATTVGDVMGKYHPHGDSAIYDTVVRMAQPFSLRYPLVDGQGNFGSIDDDPAAAMRYTEARLSRIATELLRDIDANTVDFEPNYDESRRQPSVLPSRFPNLLVNGSTGIAVGMATNMPPHHLGETIDAVVAMIDNPEIDVEGLMRHVKGPDFPTGAIIVGRTGIRDAYRTGRGRVVMRARAHIEELRGGKSAIVITELPYGVKKGGDTGVIVKIADLVRDKVLTEISDLADHSDRTGMRIQVELKRDAVPQVALNKLFKHTPLQSTFGYNAVALVDGVPRTLSLLELVTHYLDFQREVVTRRAKYDLRKAEDRAHVLAGYLIALDNIDAIVALIRAAADADEARTQLMERFALSEIQAQAILDMRLARLTGLARKEVEAEYKDLQERIAELRALLGDQAKIDAVIREELLEIKHAYGRNDDRRTEIVAAEEELELEDLIAEEDMVIAITRSGYIKRLPVTTYREQRRGGIGVMGMELKEDDYIEHLFVASTHDYILFFTNVGKVYRLKVHELPLGSRQSKGRAIVNLLPFRQDETVRAVVQTQELRGGEIPRLRDEERRRQEDRARRLQHAAESRRDHRDQDARRRRARRRPPLLRRRRHPHGLEEGAGDPLPREGRARDGPRHLRRLRHEAPRRRRGDRDQHRRGRRRPADRDRERLRQADARFRVPGQGARRDGRQDGAADRGSRHPRRLAGRPRRIPGDADLHRRHRDPDSGRRVQAARPLDAGRHRDAAARRRDRLGTRARRRVGGDERLRRGRFRAGARGDGRGGCRRRCRNRGRYRRVRRLRRRRRSGRRVRRRRVTAP